MEGALDPIPNASLVDHAAHRVREAILAGEMQPGEPIRIRQLQDSLGISHIPIREALHQLEAEGLVVAPPRRTPQVAGVALEELSALYDLRRMIEVPTARAARAAATAAQEQEVHEAFSRFMEEAEKPPSSGYWARHTQFHWSLIAAGANPWTRRILDPLWRASERYVRLFVTTFGTPERAQVMHRDLLNAWDSRDGDRLADALTEHFTETERVVSEGFLSRAGGDGTGS